MSLFSVGWFCLLELSVDDACEWRDVSRTSLPGHCLGAKAKTGLDWWFMRCSGIETVHFSSMLRRDLLGFCWMVAIVVRTSSSSRMFELAKPVDRNEVQHKLRSTSAYPEGERRSVPWWWFRESSAVAEERNVD